MNTKLTATILASAMLASFNALAGDHDNFDKKISATFGKQDYSESTSGDKIKANVFGLGFSYYMNPITASEYPIDERAFASQTSSLDLSWLHASGELSSAGTKILDLTGNTYSGEVKWKIPDSQFVVIAGLDLDKSKFSAAMGPGEQTSDKTKLKIGGGAFFDQSSAASLTLTTGKEKASASTAPSLAADGNKISGYELNYKKVSLMPENKAFSFKIGYKTETITGDTGTGGKKDETSSDITLDLLYYLNKETGIGFLYDKSSNKDNISGSTTFGEEATYGVGLSKHINPNLNFIGILSKGKGGNNDTGDSTLIILQMNYLY